MSGGKKLRIMLPGGVVHAQRPDDNVGPLTIDATALCGQPLFYPSLTLEGVSCRKCLHAMKTR